MFLMNSARSWERVGMCVEDKTDSESKQDLDEAEFTVQSGLLGVCDVHGVEKRRLVTLQKPLSFFF